MAKTASSNSSAVRSFAGNFIDGAWLAPSSGIHDDIINPATEEVIGSAPRANAADAEAAIVAARKAFDHGPWPRMSGADRSAKLRDFYDALKRRSADLLELMVLETATVPMLLDMAVNMPMQQLEACIEFARRDPVTSLPVSLHPNMLGGKSLGAAVSVREPVGVVSAITPFNFPFLVNMLKVAPALAAGCTMVLKSSPYTPLQTLLFGEIAEEIGLPPGVLNVIHGEGEAGEIMASHPLVDMVTFTGSDHIGALVNLAAAKSMKRVTLELGGKSAVIVRKDADIEQAIAWIMYNQAGHAGQGCARTSRILVDRAIKKVFVDQIIAAAKAVTVGDIRDPNTYMGPLIREVQRKRTEDAVASALRKGDGTLIHGGRRPPGVERGFFYEVTLFDDVANDSTLGQEEIFGPVGAIMGFDSDDEAIALANDSRYGLGGSIWSRDVGGAFEMARKIRTGNVYLNGGTGGYQVLEPFGGYKHSGLGREMGAEGFNGYTELKSIMFHAG